MEKTGTANKVVRLIYLYSGKHEQGSLAYQFRGMLIWMQYEKSVEKMSLNRNQLYTEGK